MDWFAPVDNYCERVGPGFWSEPVNAMTNLAFLVAAVIGWRMAARAGDRVGLLLAGILAAIGAGSFLFHTFAQPWAGVADVLPILLYILVYVYAATVRFFGAPLWAGLAAAGLFFPYSMAVGGVVEALAGPLNGSVSYVPVPLLILAYGAVLRRRARRTARGLVIGAGIVALSLTFRTIDEALCGVFPLGTHFLWHVLNAAMLGWMIAVLVRHGRSGTAPA